MKVLLHIVSWGPSGELSSGEHCLQPSCAQPGTAALFVGFNQPNGIWRWQVLLLRLSCSESVNVCVQGRRLPSVWNPLGPTLPIVGLCTDQLQRTPTHGHFVHLVNVCEINFTQLLCRIACKCMLCQCIRIEDTLFADCTLFTIFVVREILALHFYGVTCVERSSILCARSRRRQYEFIVEDMIIWHTDNVSNELWSLKCVYVVVRFNPFPAAVRTFLFLNSLFIQRPKARTVQETWMRF